MGKKMMSKILVWRSKTGTYYYDASTPEALEWSATKILQRLVSDGMVWNPGKLIVTWDSYIVDMTDEEMEKEFPVNHELAKVKRDKAKREREREMKFYSEEKLMWDCVIGVLKGEPVKVSHEVDGMLVETPITAWRILQQRNGWEYEDYSLANVLCYDEQEKGSSDVQD